MIEECANSWFLLFLGLNVLVDNFLKLRKLNFMYGILS